MKPTFRSIAVHSSALAAALLVLAGCQREELAEPDVLSGKEGVVTFAPSVGGTVTGVKSSASEDARDGARFHFSNSISPVIDRSYRCNGHTIRAVKPGSVKIGKLYWATENLAITASGKREFNHTGHIIGDYFQWAAYTRLLW